MASVVRGRLSGEEGLESFQEEGISLCHACWSRTWFPGRVSVQSHCERNMRETQHPLASSCWDFRDGAEHRISAESKAKYLGLLFSGVSRPKENQNAKGRVC